MSFESVTGPFATLFDRYRPFWPIALPHLRQAGLFFMGWSIVLPLLTWAGQVFNASSGKGWEKAYLQGIGFIMSSSAIFLLLALVKAMRERNATSQVAGLNEDALEVRGFSLAIGTLRNSDVWDSLRDAASKNSDVTVLMAKDRTESFGVADVLADVYPHIPRLLPLPLLIWPPDRNDWDAIKLARLLYDAGTYGITLVAQTFPEVSTPSCAASAIYEVFDRNPSMPMLLVAGADGTNYRKASAKEIVPNASMMLIVHPKRIEDSVRPSVVVDGWQEADQKGRDVTKRFEEVLDRKKIWNEDGLAIADTNWIPQVSRYIEETRSGDFPGRGIYLPVPWTELQMETLDESPILGRVHRELPPIPLIGLDSKQLQGAVKAVLSRVTTRFGSARFRHVLTESGVGGGLIEAMASELGVPARGPGSDAVILAQMDNIAGSLGVSASLTTLACGIASAQYSVPPSASLVLLQGTGVTVPIVVSS